ncbi:hypothetical protein G6F55_010300 [Rhizopus delemar]|uniref:Uncharacterized protein n=2 Tax=Rhizopus TaxID=4842 RepID=A0A9P6YU58_9FUNG|nr:hypothetical protein G6F55_010300 [Rhizopus delemar]KAG1536300.1 hypothetical protein G6F51_011045 [Rhizopus arrhizus]KAG1519262.1 hypothetical protein G6F52_008790 [Rhizopus delemar]KAG1543373.1 hypothetical protein G6F49_011366 [Rhizopus delemar]KAG1564637.1 hypothetical protein G6F50_010830 [Rhizopus delemar]
MAAKPLTNAMKLLRIRSCLGVYLKTLVKNEANVVLQSIFPLELGSRGTKNKSALLKHNKFGGINCFTIAVGTIDYHRIRFKHNNVPNVAAIFQGCFFL